MKKIFVIGIGGGNSKANIEVHDVQLVVAETIEETFATLKEAWYGEKLHLDEYKALIGADGYEIQLKDQPSSSELSLFFVNMGGYLKETFGEQHAYGFYVAETEKEAKEKAKNEMLKHTNNSHVDGVFKVEDRIRFADGKSAYLHLTPDGKEYRLNPDWSGYKKLT